jgi:hypothetical protein
MFCDGQIEEDILKWRLIGLKLSFFPFRRRLRNKVFFFQNFFCGIDPVFVRGNQQNLVHHGLLRKLANYRREGPDSLSNFKLFGEQS